MGERPLALSRKLRPHNCCPGYGSNNLTSYPRMSSRRQEKGGAEEENRCHTASPCPLPGQRLVTCSHFPAPKARKHSLYSEKACSQLKFNHRGQRGEQLLRDPAVSATWECCWETANSSQSSQNEKENQSSSLTDLAGRQRPKQHWLNKVELYRLPCSSLGVNNQER